MAFWHQQLGCIFLCLSVLGHSIFYYIKIWVGQQFVRLEKQAIYGMDLFKRIFQRFVSRLLQRKVFALRQV